MSREREGKTESCLQERIAQGKEVRNKADYPTFNDVESDWDSDKEKKKVRREREKTRKKEGEEEGKAGRGKHEGEKKGRLAKIKASAL